MIDLPRPHETQQPGHWALRESGFDDRIDVLRFSRSFWLPRSYMEAATRVSDGRTRPLAVPEVPSPGQNTQTGGLC